jgi:hypothetical protein
LQIFSVQALAQQGAQMKEYQAYSVFSQRRWAGCLGGKNVKLFLCEP